jgi:CheY-like chemotaxis protein
VVFRAILEDLGQNLISVSSGEEALRQVLQRDFAVILLDVNMPGLDGLETAALIPRPATVGARAHHLHHRRLRR